MFNHQPLTSALVTDPTIAPEMYTRSSNNCFLGATVTGTILEYSYDDKMLYGVIEGTDKMFFIKQENFYPDIQDDFSSDNIPQIIKVSIPKRIVGIIVGTTHGIVELNRISRVVCTYRLLKELYVGYITQAVITNITSFGVFVDIGCGVTSLVHITELSLARYSRIENFLNVGDTILVKILKFDEEKKHFILSRKQAYQKVDVGKGIIICKICDPTPDGGGYFVEYNPATIGIVDVPFDCRISSGQSIRVYVSKHNEHGFQANLQSIIKN